MSIQRIYMLGSTRVHKCSRRPCMPEYGSRWQTLHIYAYVCICEECERCLLIVLNVMKIVEVDFVVPWIFYSFNDVLLVLILLKCFWELIGLLSNYHNRRVEQGSREEKEKGKEGKRKERGKWHRKIGNRELSPDKKYESKGMSPRSFSDYLGKNKGAGLTEVLAEADAYWTSNHIDSHQH